MFCLDAGSVITGTISLMKKQILSHFSNVPTTRYRQSLVCTSTPSENVCSGHTITSVHYNKHILGITPDYIIKIRTDILQETDGPMLRYGIQSLENEKINLPASRKDWPGKDRLQQRFENFLKAV